MAYRISRASLDETRPEVEALLGRNRPRTVPYLDWIYGHNPGGPARVWLAHAPVGGPVDGPVDAPGDGPADAPAVGLLLALPRRFRLRGEPVTALNLCEIVVDPAHRHLGAAAKLTQAAWADALQRHAFGFDHLVQSTLPVYQRLGWATPLALDHWLLPCSAPSSVRSRARSARATLRRATPRALVRTAGLIEVEPLSEPCGPELDALDRRLAGRQPIEPVRDARHLQWRYLDNLFVPHEILVARRRGRPVGYLVFRGSYYPDDPSLALVDVLVEREGVLRDHLLPALLEVAAERGADGIWAEVVAGNPSCARFLALGFAPASAARTRRSYREAEHFVIDGPPDVIELYRRGGWWLNAGDQYPS